MDEGVSFMAYANQENFGSDIFQPSPASVRMAGSIHSFLTGDIVLCAFSIGGNAVCGVKGADNTGTHTEQICQKSYTGRHALGVKDTAVRPHLGPGVGRHHEKPL